MDQISSKKILKIWDPYFWDTFLLTHRSPLRRYGLASFVSLFSLALVIGLQHIEGGPPLKSLAVMSVILSALYGGRGPALFDTLITSIGIDYFFTRPMSTLFGSYASIMNFLIYLLVGLVITLLAESLKEAFRELKKQKLLTERVIRARENVLGIVSHDLRTPLASVIMNTEFILRQLRLEKSPTNLEGKLEMINSSARRAERLIDDLRDAMKVDSGNFRVDMVDHDFGDDLVTALEESTALASSTTVSFRVLRSGVPAPIFGDPGRIVQVINNLLSNALKFSPPGSSIEIIECIRDEWVVLTVSDSGPGIPEEDRERLFDRYWQASSSAHKGTGLGLFISRAITNLHGGELFLGSGSSGACFILRFPLRKS